MRLVLYQAEGGKTLPGLLTDRGVISLAEVVEAGHTPELTMEGIINNYESLKPSFERLADHGEATSLKKVKLLPPLPRPGKILACIANYWEHAQREARPLNMFLKSPDAVVGPGDTITLPEFT